jgi:hypothetical protein
MLRLTIRFGILAGLAALVARGLMDSPSVSHQPLAEASPSRAHRLETLLANGQAAYFNSRFDESTAAFNEAWILSGEDVDVLEWRAISRMAAKDFAGPFDDFTTVVARRPGSADAWRSRAFAAAAIHKADDMVTSVREAERLGQPVEPRELLAWTARNSLSPLLEAWRLANPPVNPDDDQETQFKSLYR